MVESVPLVMEVHPSVPAKTVPEFIAYAKANPGKLNMASAGIGGPQHIAGELFKFMAGVDLTHIPYKGFFELHRIPPDCQNRLLPPIVGLSSSLEVHQPPRACG
jgi:tripartite-type tricarboxylate transporter receptor subunit TctC